MSESTHLPNLFENPTRDSRPQVATSAPLPMSKEEMDERGWQEVDVVFITGDAYVDSPSFANGLLTRLIERDGFKVAVLSQPDWNSADDFRRFGRPRLAFFVSAGNMDSMLNHYTANRRVRNEDAYTPGGKRTIGDRDCRPDRATLAYSQRAREAFPGVPIVIGGIEASLRRIAHYDYWSDKVRRSILLDAKADLLSYGMGERATLEILRRLDNGETIASIRDVRGTVYRLGKSEDLPEESDSVAHLPSFEEVEANDRESKYRFVKMTQTAYENLNPYRAKTLVQEHADEAIVVNPPAFPLSEADMDAVYELPYTRKPHPSYTEPIPATEVVDATVLAHRGCFGGCSFCAITAHQGKFIQTRSQASIVKEIEVLAKERGGDYVVGDLNAPTANMYKLGGKNFETCKKCARVSCLCPNVCPNLNTDQSEYVKLLRAARGVEGVKAVLVASGIRSDLANFSPEFIEELAAHHTGGRLKTAPEHTQDEVLKLMNKPPIASYEQFCDSFYQASEKCGKEQYLVPYLISGFPGCTLADMVAVAEYLKANNIEPEQVQDFIPAPFQLATCAYYTGIDPLTEKPVYVPRGMRERRLQNALLFYYNPEYYYDVKSALKEAGREDLIGFNEDSLIPPYIGKGMSLRQTSRIKRLIRRTEREKLEKEKRRESFDAPEETQEKRFDRERYVGANGGYRTSARVFGARSSRYESETPRKWNALEKVWETTETPESRQTERRERRDDRKNGYERDRDGFLGGRERSNFSRDGGSFGGSREDEPRRRFDSDAPFRSRDEGEFRSFRRRTDGEGEGFQREDRRSEFKPRGERSSFRRRFDGDGEGEGFKPRGVRPSFRRRFNGENEGEGFKPRGERPSFRRRFDGDGEGEGFKPRGERPSFRRRFDGDGEGEGFKREARKPFFRDRDDSKPRSDFEFKRTDRRPRFEDSNDESPRRFGGSSGRRGFGGQGKFRSRRPNGEEGRPRFESSNDGFRARAPRPEGGEGERRRGFEGGERKSDGKRFGGGKKFGGGKFGGGKKFGGGASRDFRKGDNSRGKGTSYRRRDDS